jgi:phosphate-selective porin
MINPFVEIGGLELFGVVETTSGNRSGLDDGTLTHYGGQAVYRFLDDDLFAGVRYSTVDGDLDHSGFGEPASWSGGNSADRWQISAGWYMTENIQMKAEYVTQSYEGFPADNARSDAEFDGLVIEGVVSF